MKNVLKRTTALAVVSLLSATAVTPVFAATPWPPVLRPVASADAFAQTLDMAITTIEEAMEAHSVTGVSFALIDAQTGFSFTQGFGYADTATGALVDEHTLFQVGSTSKPFTAIAIMQLVEQGLLQLDTPLASYLPQFSMLPSFVDGSGDYTEITPRMLLSNTSGIMQDYLRGFFQTGDMVYHGVMNDLLPRLASREMNFDAGTQFMYANLGWTVLGILAAQMHGYSDYFAGFASLTAEHIFAPLGMDRSTFHWTPALANVAMSYLDADTPDDFTFTPIAPAGGMFSSAHDMALFMHDWLGGGSAVLAPETIAYMMSDHTADVDMPAVMSYGLGFMRFELPSGVTWGHGGNIVHYHTEMIFDVDNGLGVFISTNSGTGMSMASPVAHQILQSAVREKTGAGEVDGMVELDTDADALTVVELPMGQLLEIAEVFAHVYDFGVLGRWELVLVGEQFVMQTDGMEIPLTFMSDGALHSLEMPIGGHYLLELTEGLPVVHFVAGGEILVGTPVSEANDYNPLIALIEPWLGVYNFVPQIESEFSIIESVEVLVNDMGTVMFMQNHALHGATGGPLSYVNGRWLVAGVMPVLFELSDDGAASVDLFGGVFVR